VVWANTSRPHEPWTVDAAVAWDLHLESQRVPHHRYISDAADHGVAVHPGGAAPWAVGVSVVEQGAERHGGPTVDGGVGDCHPSSTVRTIVSATTAAGKGVGSGTGLPGWQVCKGVGTCILCRPGPVSAHRHDPITGITAPSAALHFRKSQLTSPHPRLRTNHRSIVRIIGRHDERRNPCATACLDLNPAPQRKSRDTSRGADLPVGVAAVKGVLACSR
jgi:hypothetical protein